MHKAWAALRLHGGRPWMRTWLCVWGLGCLPVLAGAQSTVVYIPALTTVAGNGTAGHTGDGGVATAAELQGPQAGTFDSQGNMYIADATAFAVRKVAAGTGIITTIAGVEGTEGAGCTNGTLATLCAIDDPYAVAVDAAGNVYISDPNYNTVRVVSAATGDISIFAGIPATTANTANTPQYSGDGGQAALANLYFPTDLMMDAAGKNLYIADSKNGAVRKVNIATGIITLVAGVEGKTCGSGTVTVPAAACGDGGQALAANLSSSVYGIYFDAAGNLYIADTRTYRIRKVNASTGIITSVAGTGLTGTLVSPYVGPANGDWGPALSSNLVFPQRVAVDSAGAVYAVDSSDNEIRRVDPVTGIITNYLGNGNTPTPFAANAPGNKVNGPVGAWFDSLGNLYFADRNETVIRKVVTNLFFPATAVASSNSVQDVYFSTYATDTFTASGVTTGYKDFTSTKITGCNIGTSTAAYNTCTLPVTFTPQLPGLRTAQINTTDGTSNFVTGVVGVGNAPSTAIYPSNISSIAGNGTAGYTGDNGNATASTLAAPAGMALDSEANIYFADTSNNAVRRITAAGVISTIAGTGTAGYMGDGSAATSAELSGPTAVALDAAGDVFIADTGNNAIRRVDAGTGKISTYAGTGVASYSGDAGPAINAQLSAPAGVIVDTTGNLYIADTGNNRIREVFSGIINTVAGTGTAGETGDGGAGTSAELNSPMGLALGPDFGIEIADTGNNVIRKYLPSTGVISKLAGSGTAGYSGDGGTPTAATLSAPKAVSVDAAGNLYIADTANNVVRFVYNGTITTIAGNRTAGYTGDTGLSTSAEINKPAGIAVNLAGALLIGDTANNAIRSINSSEPTITFPQQAVNTTSSAQTELLVNTGNLTLTLTGLTIPTAFAQIASGGTDCTATTTLAAGAGCFISLDFTPTTPATDSGSVSLSDNALNSTSSKQTILLSGAGYIIPTSLALSGVPASVVAGVPQSLTVKPMAAGAAIPSFTGTVHFTSTDPNAVLPADYTYTSGDAGSHTFTVTLKTAATSQCITVTDSAFSLSSQACATVVAAGPATVSVYAGNNQTAQINNVFATALQVLVVDAYSNPVPNQTVSFTPVPSGGASATFATGTATTASTGIATASTLTANGTVGSYTVNATVTGVSKAATFSLTNSQFAVPTTTLATTPSGTSVYGQSVTLTATVSSSGTTQPTGTVTFYDTPASTGIKTQVGTAQTIVAKTASVSDAVPVVGAHVMTASYSGDSNFSANQANANLTVTQATVMLSGPATQPVPINAGQTGTVLVSVTGVSAVGAASPTGTLTYTIGTGTPQTAPVSNSQATLTVPNTLAAGNYSIALSYGGDTNYLTATGTVTIVVSQQSQTITFPTIPTQTYGNAPVTLAATASSGLAVTYKVDSGPAVLATNTLKLEGAGKVCVEADQAGNTAYLAATAVQQCFVVSLSPTTTLLAVAANPSVLNQAANFTATLSLPGTSYPTGPTGSVTFYNGTATLGTGTLSLVGTTYTATFSTAALPLGTNSITATYSGDANFLTSTSTTLVQTVAAPTFTIVANPTTLTITNGQSGSVTLTLTSLYTYAGTVSFSCNPLPRQSYCYTTTPTLTLTSNGTSTTTLTIQTTPTGGLFTTRLLRGNGTALLAMLPAMLLLLPFARKRRRWPALLLTVLLLGAGLNLLSGCASTANTQILPAGTPTGVTNVVIFATDGTTTQSVPLTVTVQ